MSDKIKTLLAMMAVISDAIRDARRQKRQESGLPRRPILRLINGGLNPRKRRKKRLDELRVRLDFGDNTLKNRRLRGRKT